VSGGIDGPAGRINGCRDETIDADLHWS
jgi:hypothetical protein